MLAAYNVARRELLDDPKLPFSVARLCECNRLILAGLDLEDDVVPGEIRRHSIPTLTSRLAAAYATKTEKTLSRDLNAIKALGLLRQETDGWVPADESIQKLLPQAVDGVLWE